MSYIDEMLEYIEKSGSAYQAVCRQKKMLEAAGFTELHEDEEYDIALGGNYYVVRGGSALIAFRVPASIPNKAVIMATHSDTPSFKIKNNPEMKVDDAYVKLNVEPYGGAIYSTWFDRPLSVAGRLFVKTNGSNSDPDEGLSEYVKEIPVDADEDLLMIPSLAIHFDRDTNKGHAYDAQKELLPIMSLDASADLMTKLCEKVNITKENLVSHDLFVYNREKAVKWGSDAELVSSPRLDDAACAFASVKSLIDADSAKEAGEAAVLRIHAMFNNEEVGSSSRCGACSTFLSDTLERVAASLSMYGTQYQKMLASSFMLSADNAHAFHPNYPEKNDPTNKVYLGRGIALKFAGNQKYTTDAESAAFVWKLADKAQIKLQKFHNNSNIAGGSTLGNLLVHSLPILCADVGIPQLAMHSAYETCAISDAEDMYKLGLELYKAE